VGKVLGLFSKWYLRSGLGLGFGLYLLKIQYEDLSLRPVPWVGTVPRSLSYTVGSSYVIYTLTLAYG
jgi:hypothetical protein